MIILINLQKGCDYESSTDVFYTEIVTELVTEIDDFVTSENTTVTPKYRGSSSSVPTNRKPSEPKDDDTPVRVKNRPIRDGDAGLWIAIAVVCVAAIVVVFLLLASVVLRWRRAEESSYNLERSVKTTIQIPHSRQVKSQGWNRRTECTKFLLV
ncbi:hypothetical protein BSL78_10228 [Apostichopus japonicus]|uniref:Uncharacterized protein n=1 Tax=Stichopus japonicus TaxID=307972 RepID=A0A2G8KY07_STIJA|nr:hypothetical protein BSL78_10228 [Apostichopus japonicus]